MKQLFTLLVLTLGTISTYSQANTKLSNLASPTAVNQHLLPNSTNARDLGSSTYAWRNLYLRGYVYLDGTRFVSNHPGTGNFNAFVGSNAGYAVTTGKNNSALGHYALYKTTSGYSNTASGAYALYNNTAGYSNIALGTRNLFTNTTGYQNTAVGDSSMYAANSFNNTAVGFMTLGKTMMTGGANTAIGHEAMANNTSGDNNVAIGRGAMRANTGGYLNTAVGSFAMSQSGSGTQNVAVGRLALDKNNGQSNIAVGNESMAANANGSFNTAVGYRTLQNTLAAQFNTVIGYLAAAKYDNGYNNVFVGANSDVNGPGYFNVIAIGQGTICTAPSQVTIGNGATNSYRAYANWSNISDGRYKKNLQENVPGLAFINKLRPVTYNLDAGSLDALLNKGRSKEFQPSDEAKAVMAKALKEKEAVVQTGFVAQEVEKAAKALNYDFSGVDAPKNSNDVYGLRYSDFVVPLVKAVQELSKTDEELTKKTQEIEALKSEVAELRKLVLELKNSSANVTSSYLDQNTPNPVSGTTVIKYHIPEIGTSARLNLTNTEGQVVKTLTLSKGGTGQVSLNTVMLASGNYNYTLYVDGKPVDSKRLVVAR